MPTQSSLKRCFLSAKIHGATITCANLEYEGSLSIDTALLREAGILPCERVDVYNLDNGERLTTYAIPGEKGEICLNGAAAHKGRPGQRVIIATYAWLDPKDYPDFTPTVVMAGKDNEVSKTINYQVPDSI